MVSTSLLCIFCLANPLMFMSILRHFEEYWGQKLEHEVPAETSTLTMDELEEAFRAKHDLPGDDVKPKETNA